MTVKRLFEQKVKELLALCADERDDAVIVESDLKDLPDPVQRYLRFSEVVGKPRARRVHLRQKGQIRMNPEQGWIPLVAEEVYTTDPPGFVWFCRAKMNPLLYFDALDSYMGGEGQMVVRLLSLVKVVDAMGSEMNQGAMMRYLNETMWFPTALLDERIRWEAINSDSARAIFTFSDMSVSADYYFDECGRLTNFEAERYRSVGSEFVMEKWSTPVYAYQEYKDLVLPSAGEAIWHLEDDDFSYIKLEITDIAYDERVGFW